MSLELTPLKPGQHPVTRLPKFTTELPFFYLTKRKELLSQPIHFKSTDQTGRPLVWNVTPNISPSIGAPGIEAHQVWVKLVKPAIDAKRQPDGSLPSVIPLGSIRQSLSLLGWKIGGWEAKDFLKAIHQIGSAWCEADFWLPTAKTDEQGKPLFRRIKAAFSRLSLYAIGEVHFTEEELQTGRTNFAFDLEDTVYIQLHPIELEIQRHEGQRLVDNEYLFSVSPTERRWYELLAPKFYGVTNNPERSPGFCEIRYSWYIERHHTLKRETARNRVVHQMNRLIHDHRLFGYVLRVDYRPVREPDKEDDYIIRYYPGQFAHQTAQRILTRLRQKGREQVRATQIVLPIQSQHSAPQEPLEVTLKPVPEALPKKEDPLPLKLVALGITTEKAEALVTNNREAVTQELAALPERNLQSVKDVAGWLIRAIERGNYSQPKPLSEQKERAKKRQDEQSSKALEIARQSHEKRFEDEYTTYLQQQVEEIKKSHLEVYSAFEEATAAEREKTARVFRNAPTLIRKVFEAELIKYFRDHPDCPLLDFWQWDAQINPHSFQSQ